MYFYLIGTDYKTAPLNARASFYHRRQELIVFWQDKNAALLSTCNRMEIYAVSQNADTAFGYLAEFSRSFSDFFQYAYLKYGEREVFQHALRLASGLESQIQGELEILSQLQGWLKQESLPFRLREVWEKVLVLAGDIRGQCGLDKDTVNIAEVVFSDLSQRLKPDGLLEIIVVGTGKIAGLFAQHRPPYTRLNFLAHKNYQKAKELARISGGRAFLLKDLAQVLPQADALISATASPHYVLKKEDFFNVHHPFYLYDLALPPDIEPVVKGLPGIFLQNLDDLTGRIQLFNQRNQEKIQLASRLIDEIAAEHPEAAYAKNN